MLTDDNAWSLGLRRRRRLLALAHLLVLAGLRGGTEEHDGHEGRDDDEAHGDLHLP